MIRYRLKRRIGLVAASYYRSGEGHGWTTVAADATLYTEHGFALRDWTSLAAPLRSNCEIERVELPDLNSANVWLKDPKYAGLVVIDPDGWDRSNFEASWAEKITQAEFERRVVVSTCKWPRALLTAAAENN